jgi:hypothetical protein
MESRTKVVSSGSQSGGLRRARPGMNHCVAHFPIEVRVALEHDATSLGAIRHLVSETIRSQALPLDVDMLVVLAMNWRPTR